jgi:hypothetical protein
VSIPKSGRTWIRFFLTTYFAHKHGLGAEFEVLNGQGGAPRITFTHDYFQNVVESSLVFRFKGKAVVPPALRGTKRILLIARDPRDAVVSLYFHQSRRAVRRQYQGTIEEFIRDPSFGIDNIVRIMNLWAGEFNVLHVRYESLKADVDAGFRRILGFIGPDEKVDEVALRHALDASSFDRMKELERSSAGARTILGARDVGDPESYKVRKGKVGGFRDYLSPAGIACVDAAFARLDPRFGYSAG